MKLRSLLGVLCAAVLGVAVSGCAGIPPEQQKNYALIVSDIGEYGYNMEQNPNQNVAYVSYVDGSPEFPAEPEINLPPGPYKIQVGIYCGNSATCRPYPNPPFNLVVEAGKRYVLKTDGVYVSNRFASRSGEVRYQAH